MKHNIKICGYVEKGKPCPVPLELCKFHKSLRGDSHNIANTIKTFPSNSHNTLQDNLSNLSQTNLTQYECSICNKKFIQSAKNEKKIHMCEECNKIYESQDNFQDNLQIKNDELINTDNLQFVRNNRENSPENKFIPRWKRENSGLLNDPIIIPETMGIAKSVENVPIAIPKFQAISYEKNDPRGDRPRFKNTKKFNDTKNTVLSCENFIGNNDECVINTELAVVLNKLSNDYKKKKQLRFFLNQIGYNKNTILSSKNFVGTPDECSINTELAYVLNKLTEDYKKKKQLGFFLKQIRDD